METKNKKNKQSVKTVAVRLLASRDRSSKELTDRLTRDFSPEEVDETIKYLEKIGYVDDLRYASHHVEYRNRVRPTGNFLLRLELNQKGIKDEHIEEVLNPPEVEYELALSVANKRLVSLQKLEEEVRIRRIYGLLQRRGFSGTTARSVVSQLLDRDLENEYN